MVWAIVRRLHLIFVYFGDVRSCYEAIFNLFRVFLGGGELFFNGDILFIFVFFRVGNLKKFNEFIFLLRSYG